MESTGDALARAEALLNLRRYEDAIQLTGATLAREPENATAQALLARAYLLADRNADAVAAAQKASTLAPEAALPHRVRAEALLGLGQNQIADQAATRACELDPNDAFNIFVRVKTLLALGRIGDAQTLAPRVAELAPMGTIGYQARGLVLIKRKEWHAVEEEYQRALALAPNDPALLNNYGLALLNLGRETEAIAAFTRAGEIDPRQDLFRRNTALAARRHIGEGVGRRQSNSRMWIAAWIAGWIGLRVLATTAPVVLTVVIGVLVLVVLPAYLVQRRRRLRNLPRAAQIALEIEDRKASSIPGLSRRQVRIGGTLIAALVLGVITMAIITEPDEPAPHPVRVPSFVSVPNLGAIYCQAVSPPIRSITFDTRPWISGCDPTTTIP